MAFTGMKFKGQQTLKSLLRVVNDRTCCFSGRPRSVVSQEEYVVSHTNRPELRKYTLWLLVKYNDTSDNPS